MCRNCGAIVGAGQQQCAVCGSSVTAPAATRSTSAAPDHETLRFARAVLDRPYKFTIILLAANLFVFMLMWSSSGMSFSVLQLFPSEVLIRYGAKLNLLIRTSHQWWRFVTPMFLHVNLIHILVNMYSLWVVGPYVEKLYGSAKFVVFWVVTGICAVLASYFTVTSAAVTWGPFGRFLFRVDDAPSAGASGALFGLVGILFVFGIKFRHELPEGFKRAFGTGLLPMIFLNLFIGYVGRGFIDNAAHLGGLVSGALIALVVDYRRPDERMGTAIVWRVLQVAAIALVAMSFVQVVRHYHDPLPAALAEETQAPPATDGNPQKFVAYAQAMNDAQDAFALILKDGDASKADDAIKELESAPLLDPKANELRENFKLILTKAKLLKLSMAAPREQATRNNQRGLEELTASYEDWSKEYGAWLKTTGRSYGLVEETQPQESPK
jgi:rhomboid protease GluP